MGDGPLHGIQACVFDAYGTLLDFNAAAAGCRDLLGDKLEALSALWREKQLQYTWLRAVQGRHADFWQVTADALDYALATLGIGHPDAHSRLMALYLKLDAFPEVPTMLEALKHAGVRTAILSNGTPQMLAAALAHARLDGLLDIVLSVESTGIYKPHPRVYQLAVEAMEVPAEAILFVSANGWDAWAASAFGLRAVWCNRRAQQPERLPGAPDRTVQSLAELPALLGL